MNYEFDLFGWYTGMSVEPSLRTTTEPPQNMQTHAIEGLPRSNWTGMAWLELPFSAHALPPEPLVPEIVITAMVGDKEGVTHTEDFTDATVPVGTTLNFTAELRAGGELQLLDDVFRMPIRSRDGRERVLLAPMTQGVISFSVHFDVSRVWEVTEALVNADLPRERHMRFAGIKVFAVEA